jgi:hypothetical protein
MIKYGKILCVMIYDNGDRSVVGGVGGEGGVVGNDNSVHQLLKPWTIFRHSRDKEQFWESECYLPFFKKQNKNKIASCLIVSQKFPSRVLTSYFFKAHFNP